MFLICPTSLRIGCGANGFPEAIARPDRPSRPRSTGPRAAMGRPRGQRGAKTGPAMRPVARTAPPGCCMSGGERQRLRIAPARQDAARDGTAPAILFEAPAGRRLTVRKRLRKGAGSAALRRTTFRRVDAGKANAGGAHLQRVAIDGAGPRDQVAARQCRCSTDRDGTGGAVVKPRVTPAAPGRGRPGAGLATREPLRALAGRAAWHG